MSGNDPTHELLTEVGSHVRSQPPVVADVMAQVAKEPSRRPGRRRRWIVGGIPAGLAACLALVVGVWHVATTPAKGLHERAMSALADVRSAHVVDRRHVDGTWRVNTELWYVRGMGVREEVHYEEATRVRVDDGRTQWRYWSGES